MLKGRILMYNFKNLKQFENSWSNLVARTNKFDIYNLDLPKENQVWVIKINTDKYGFDCANDIFMSIKNQYPDVPMFGVASDIDICPVDINFLIEELEKTRTKK